MRLTVVRYFNIDSPCSVIVWVRVVLRRTVDYNSCDVSLENLVLDKLIIPLLISVFILITCLYDIEQILY